MTDEPRNSGDQVAYQAQKPFYCRNCDSGFLSHVRLVEHDCEPIQETAA